MKQYREQRSSWVIQLCGICGSKHQAHITQLDNDKTCSNVECIIKCGDLAARAKAEKALEEAFDRANFPPWRCTCGHR